MTAYDFRVLGPLEVHVNGHKVELGGPRQRAVLALLLVNANHVVSLDRLIEGLWGDAPPSAASGSIQAYVANLRRALEPDRPPRAPAQVLVTHAPGYALRVGDEQLDSVRFERALERTRELLGAAEPSAAKRTVVDALALWRGDALADFASETFAQSEIRRLEELRGTGEELAHEATQQIRSGPAMLSSDTTRQGQNGSGEVFVGREGELTQLARAWDAAVSGRPGGVVITGEAGVGKTRLVEHFAESSVDDPARVIWARNYEDSGAPALWPWLSALRELALDDDGELPKVDGIDDHDTAVGARTRLFDSLAARLRTAVMGRGPVFLVVDDLQWADTTSAEFLEYALRDLGRTPLLIIVTVRVDPPMPNVVIELLARVARLGYVQEIDLGNLTLPDVAVYVDAMAPAAEELSHQTLAERLHSRTNGNAFFMAESMRLLASQKGDLAAVPTSVRAVVHQRVGRLPGETRRTLDVAAVIGREFSLDLLSRSAELALDHALDALEPALVTQLLVEAPHLGRFRFAHPIVAEALYQELPAPRRARLHATVAERLDNDPGHAGVVELAHHYVRASSAGATLRAVDAAMRAARHEEQRLAFPDATMWWDRSLSLLDLSGASQPRLRHELELGLGRACWLAGDLEASTAALHRALDLAEQIDDPELVLKATIRSSTMTWRHRRHLEYDRRSVAALERVLADHRDRPEIRSRALSYLARELQAVPGPSDVATAHAAEALRLAREVDHAGLMAHALHAQVLLGWRAEHLDLLAVAGQEMAQLRPPAVPANVSLLGRLALATARLRSGHADGFGAEIDDCWKEARGLELTVLQAPLALARSTAALLVDDVNGAARLSEQAFEIHRQVEPLGSNDFRGLQLLDISRQQGRLLDHANELTELSRANTHPYAHSITVGLIELARGDLERVEAALERSPDVLPANWSSLATLSLQAELAAAVGSPLAMDFYDAMLPFADRIVVLGPAIVCRGSVHHFLGLLARVVHPEKADDHLRKAAGINRSIGLRWWADQSVREARQYPR